DATPFNQILKQNAKREMRLRLGKVTVADVLAAQPVTTNLLKFMRASIKMIGVSNLQSFIASMTQDRKSGSAGMPRPISYAVFCLKKKTVVQARHHRLSAGQAVMPVWPRVIVLGRRDDLLDQEQQ